MSALPLDNADALDRGRIHRFAMSAEEESTAWELTRQWGNNQYTVDRDIATFQLRTLRVWREAVDAVKWRYGHGSEAYHAACDDLWSALPHGADWRDEVHHATFVVYAAKVRDE